MVSVVDAAATAAAAAAETSNCVVLRMCVPQCVCFLHLQMCGYRRMQ